VKYLVVRRAHCHEYLLALQSDLAVLGKQTILSVEPCFTSPLLLHVRPVVKLQLVSARLEKRLGEELESSDRLRARLAKAQQENTALKDEKQQVVRLIANKVRMTRFTKVIW
jgi:hypothetical protein